jgi:hypothetical protein
VFAATGAVRVFRVDAPGGIAIMVAFREPSTRIGGHSIEWKVAWVGSKARGCLALALELILTS